jgi:FtsZ-binding cell division protein ZapB
MAEGGWGELVDTIIDEQQDEIFRLWDENHHLRKTSQDQRRINGALREENSSLRKELFALVVDY